MELTAAVITVSDKGSRGEREDTSGPAVAQMLTAAGYKVIYTAIIPDDIDIIKDALIECCDEMAVCLAVTTGGTGFSPRDVTPEATLAIAERAVPGIPEAMRAYSMTITSMAMLSRAASGIRGGTLIVNLPGSRKAAEENLGAILTPLKHGIDILRGSSSECALIHTHKEKDDHA